MQVRTTTNNSALKRLKTGAKLLVLGPPLFVIGVTFTLLTHAFWERDSNGCPKFPYWMKKTGGWMCGI
jgi:hypothetical protein